MSLRSRRFCSWRLFGLQHSKRAHSRASRDSVRAFGASLPVPARKVIEKRQVLFNRATQPILNYTARALRVETWRDFLLFKQIVKNRVASDGKRRGFFGTAEGAVFRRSRHSETRAKFTNIGCVARFVSYSNICSQNRFRRIIPIARTGA